MANIIKPKRSNTAGKVPTTSDLTSGELGVNMADKKAYINNGTSVVQIGAGNLAGLGDVALTSPSNGQSLVYNGTNWVNQTGAGSGDVVGPSSATDNALARFDTTTGKLIQNSVVVVDDSGNMSGVPTITDINYIDFNTGYATTLGAGQLGWDGNDTLGLGMIGGNVIQHIGEDQFFYCKASSAISKGQVVMFTGAVGASGVPTGAPATGITDGTYIMGVAAEAIALNGFGLVQSFGTLRNVNTSGYSDGDILWYNPSVAGGLTSTKPSAPNIKAQIAAVINGGSSGGGTILIRINAGSTLGGTDSNAQINGASNGQFITYDGTGGYWKNTSISAGTAISVSSSSTGVLTITNTAPDQTVVLTGAGTTTVTGTYPNFTITSNDQYTGTVTSVGMTVPTGLSISGSPITTSGTLALTFTAGYSIPTTTKQGQWDTAYSERQQWDGGSTNLVAATGRTSLGATTLGSNIFTITNPSAITFPRFNADNTISALDAATFRTAIGAGTGSGTVTSVAALTIGTTGTDLSSTVATGTTTPVITLNVPTASASNRGALSSTDWSTFNGKQAALVSGTNIKTVNSTSLLGSGNLAVGTITSVTGTSPVASSGGTTPAISLASGYGDTQNPYASKTANYVLAAPNGAAGVPTFRAIVAADIPTLNQNTTGSSGSCTGNAATATTASGVSAGVVAGKMVYDTFTANGSTTSFTTSATYTSGKIEVYCNGVKMRNGSDVTVTSGTAVVFASAPANTSLIDVVYPT